MPTSRGRGFAPHGTLGCFAVTLVIYPARFGGRWLGMVISDTLVGYAGAATRESDLGADIPDSIIPYNDGLKKPGPSWSTYAWTRPVCLLSAERTRRPGYKLDLFTVTP